MALTKPSPTTLVRPANKSACVIRRFTVGTGGVTAADVVTTGADGIVPCDGDDATYKTCVGIALQTGAAGDVVDVVTHGPVAGFTGATIGTPVYPSDATAGLPSQTASTNKHSVGVMESASVLFVRPTYIA